MPDEVEDRLEQLLDPLIAGWNKLQPSQLRGLHDCPLSTDPNVLVTYISEARTPFGYEYVEFEIRLERDFEVRIRIEGHPGEISTAAYLPVVDVRSGDRAFWTWLSDRRSPISDAVFGPSHDLG